MIQHILQKDGKAIREWREKMSGLQFAIMATMIAYLCFVIVTGIMIGRRSKKSAEGFYLGGRGIGPLSGVADAGWTAIGLAIGTYLNFLLVAKKIRRYSVRLDAITIPSFISKRYGEKKPVIMCIASVAILVFFVPYVASGLAAIGKLFNSLFGWDYMLAVLLGAVVIISYTSVGGFRADHGPDPVYHYDLRPGGHHRLRHLSGRRS